MKIANSPFVSRLFSRLSVLGPLESFERAMSPFPALARLSVTDTESSMSEGVLMTLETGEKSLLRGAWWLL